MKRSRMEMGGLGFGSRLGGRFVAALLLAICSAILPGGSFLPVANAQVRTGRLPTKCTALSPYVKYNVTTGNWDCDAGATGPAKWNALTDPDGPLTLDMGAHKTTFNGVNAPDWLFLMSSVNSADGIDAFTSPLKLHAVGSNTGAAAQDVRGLSIEAVQSGAGTRPLLFGLDLVAEVDDGTVSSIYGTSIYAANFSGNVSAILRGLSVILDGADVTDAYGIQVQDVTAGITNYAIETGLGLVDFGDLVSPGIMTLAGAGTPADGFEFNCSNCNTPVSQGAPCA